MLGSVETGGCCYLGSELRRVFLNRRLALPRLRSHPYTAVHRLGSRLGLSSVASSPHWVPSSHPKRSFPSFLNSLPRLAASGRLPLLPPRLAQRLILLSAHPQPVQQHPQLARHRHHRSPFGFLPFTLLVSTLRQPHTPALQVRVRPAPAQDVMRPLHQQRSQIRVSLFADRQLRLTLGRVPPLGHHPQIAPHIPATLKPSFVSQRQHIRQRDQITHSPHLLQPLDLAILLPHRRDPVIIFLNPHGQRLDLHHQGSQRPFHRFRQPFQHF